MSALRKHEARKIGEAGKQRVPTSPGDFLREEILIGYGITQDELAAAVGVSRLTINQLVNEKRGITAEMALRLSRATGLTPQFWLNLQSAVDLAKATLKLEKSGTKIPRLIKP